MYNNTKTLAALLMGLIVGAAGVYIVTGKRMKLGIAYKKGDDFSPH